jgi:hypothetical protein
MPNFQTASKTSIPRSVIVLIAFAILSIAVAVVYIVFPSVFIEAMRNIRGEPKLLTTVEAKKLYTALESRQPAFAINMFNNGRSMVVGCYEREAEASASVVGCSSFVLTAGVWSKIGTDEIAPEFSYVKLVGNPKAVSVAGRNYIFFVVKDNPMGNGAGNLGTLHFSLYEPVKHTITALEFSGEDTDRDQVKGNFLNVDEIQSKNQTLLAFLEAEAAASPLIYRATPQDLDLDAAQNFEQRWTVDNDFDLNDDIGERVLNLRMYSENLFRLARGSVNTDVQSDHYRVVTYFRGSVIAFDKRKQVYFPVLVDRCAHICGYNAEFISGDEVHLEAAEMQNSGFRVNLDAKTISSWAK